MRRWRGFFIALIAFWFVVAAFLWVTDPFRWDLEGEIDSIEALRGLHYRSAKSAKYGIDAYMRKYSPVKKGAITDRLDRELRSKGWKVNPLPRGPWYAKTFRESPSIRASVTVEHGADGTTLITAGIGLDRNPEPAR